MCIMYRPLCQKRGGRAHKEAVRRPYIYRIYMDVTLPTHFFAPLYFFRTLKFFPSKNTCYAISFVTLICYAKYMDKKKQYTHLNHVYAPLVKIGTILGQDLYVKLNGHDAEERERNFVLTNETLKALLTPKAPKCSDSLLISQCSGCTDKNSEGTHQGCTEQHGHVGCDHA